MIGHWIWEQPMVCQDEELLLCMEIIHNRRIAKLLYLLL